MNTGTIQLPVTGWFARDYESRGGVYPYKRSTYWDEQMAGLTPDNRPFRSALVEMLANIRDKGGDVHCDANLTFAADWLELHGHIVPVRADKFGPCEINILYALTDKGRDFLKQHEAPERWQ